MSAGAFSPETKLIITARAMGMCEICRTAAIEQFHHRRPRGAGGTKRPETAWPSNGLALCSPCHTEVESQRKESLRLGYLVSQHWNPADVAVFLGGRFVMFTKHGGIESPPPEAD